jgi:hypothetical protein
VGVAGTVLGLIIGALVTILVARYYFQRSVSKKLSLYRLLNSFVFDDIAQDVRNQLQFRFQDREVKELQQVIFLVANDGERAIRDVIEPLTLAIKNDVEILDASIVHRKPEGLKVNIVSTVQKTTGTDLAMHFPLLNKGEFFVVKLLLSGRFKPSPLTILCDDLPRSIEMQPPPPDAFHESEVKFEWVPALIGLAILIVPAWACYSGFLLHGLRPSLFHPFERHQGSLLIHLDSLSFLFFGGVIILLFLVIGLGLLGLACFGGRFPPSRRARFELPKELQGMVFPYPVMRLRMEEEPGKPSDDKTTPDVHRAD